MRSRSRVAIHMGYSDLQKVYVLLDLTTQSFFVNRDVIFQEAVFPFHSKHEKKYASLCGHNL